MEDDLLLDTKDIFELKRLLEKSSSDFEESRENM